MPVNFIVVVERAFAHHQSAPPAPTHSYCSSTYPTHPTYMISNVESVTSLSNTKTKKPTRIQSAHLTTSPLCRYCYRNNPLSVAVAVVAVHDGDDYYARHVRVGLACGGGDVGDAVVQDEMEVGRILAFDQRCPNHL